MSTGPTKASPQINAEHYNKAAECCDKAAEEHRNAAKSCTSGDGKLGQDHCTKAQEHSKKAA